MKILKIDKVKRKIDDVVYDLEVEDNHNYYAEGILVSNCHGNRNMNKVTKIISKIKTPNKFGFTGTLPKENIERWKIIGTFGRVIFEKSSKELRDENFLSDVKIIMMKLNHSHKPRGYKNELIKIQSDDARHDIIKKIVSKMSKNVLILVNRLEHGENLINHLQFDDKETFFVNGSVSVQDRSDIILKMENQNNVVCVAMSAIFSTGINIKNLHYIVFAAGGKSFIRTVQAVGRGLRLHDSKNKLIIFDVYDNFKFSTAHALERQGYYIDENLPYTEISINL